MIAIIQGKLLNVFDSTSKNDDEQRFSLQILSGKTGLDDSLKLDNVKLPKGCVPKAFQAHIEKQIRCQMTVNKGKEGYIIYLKNPNDVEFLA